MSRLTAFLLEFRRRRVGRVAAAYAVIAWLLIEVANTVFPRLGLPDWTITALIITALAGLPIALILAWSFDVVPDDSTRRLSPRARRAVGITLTLGVVAMFGAMSTRVADRLLGDPEIPESIAVLPFLNLAGDLEQQYLVDGMQEAVINELSQIGAFQRVISRRSVARYRNSDRSIPEIARELNVEGVVEGTVLRTGATVEVSVRLSRARPDEVLLWSESFQRTLPEVPVLHADIARSIAARLRVQLSPDRTLRLESRQAVDPEVYDAYLRGMFHLFQGRAGVRIGLEHLHRAVRLNPGNAQAWAGLALGYANVGHGPEGTREAWQRAREAALRAIRLDPMLADGFAALADVKLYHEWDWPGAEAAFKRANELNPNLAMNHYHYAWYLALMNRRDDAIAEHKRAQELDPFTPVHSAYLGTLYQAAGRVDDAIAEAKRAIDVAPDAPAGWRVLGTAYLAKGMHEQAIAAHQKLAELNPAGRADLARTYVRTGQVDRARDLIAQMEAAPSPWNAYNLAVIYRELGDLQRAADWLVYDPPHAWLPWFFRDTPPALYRDPRIQSLIRRLDLPGLAVPAADPAM